jgi:hypothetical protein
MTAVSADEPGHKPLRPLLLDIIQWKPLQVNHLYDAQPEKQKREAYQTSHFWVPFQRAPAPRH